MTKKASSTIRLLLCVCALAGCDEQKGATPASSTSAAPVPVASATPTASAAPSAPAAAPGKSTAQLNGKSLSDVEMDDIHKALEKLGYKGAGGSGMAMGANQTITAKATSKDNKAIKVTVIRPTGKPDEGSMKMASAKSQAKDFAKKGATYLDESADVLVAVEVDGDTEAAKKLLDELVVKGS